MCKIKKYRAFRIFNGPTAPLIFDPFETFQRMTFIIGGVLRVYMDMDINIIYKYILIYHINMNNSLIFQNWRKMCVRVYASEKGPFCR